MQIPPALRDILWQLDAIACQVIRKSKEFGKTYIVTNASDGWVEQSARRLLPRTNKELDGVEVISARSRYEQQYPRGYARWKIEAFMDARKALNEHTLTNIVAFGDNQFEIEAAHVLGSKFTTSLIKTVKFRQGPSPNELIKQLKLVNK